MLIRLTEASSKHGMTLSHSVILMCRRDPANPLLTHVMTGIMGPRGLTAFEVSESPEHIALMVNQAEKAEVHPSLIGLGQFSDHAGMPEISSTPASLIRA